MSEPNANPNPAPAPASTPAPAAPTPASTADTSGAIAAELATARQQAQALQQQVEALTRERDSAQQGFLTLQQQHQQAQQQFGQVQTQLGELTNQRQTFEQQVNQLTGEVSTLTNQAGTLSRQLAMVSHISQNAELLALAPDLLPILGYINIPDDPTAQVKTLRDFAAVVQKKAIQSVDTFRQGATNPAHVMSPAPAPAQSPGTAGLFPGMQPTQGGGQPLTAQQITEQLMQVAGTNDQQYDALMNQLLGLGNTRQEN